MPKLDKTGPDYDGPKTGRRLGKCTTGSPSGQIGVGMGKARHSTQTQGKGKRLKYNYNKTILQ